MHYISIPEELGTRNKNENKFTDFSPDPIFHRIFPLNCAVIFPCNSYDGVLLNRVNPLSCKLQSLSVILKLYTLTVCILKIEGDFVCARRCESAAAAGVGAAAD